jgi:hypothetical protein
MSAGAQTVRLSPAQHRTIAGFARQRGLSEYAMLARVGPAGRPRPGAGSAIDAREIVTEMAPVNALI